jgi:hypothetical protein
MRLNDILRGLYKIVHLRSVTDMISDAQDAVQTDFEDGLNGKRISSASQESTYEIPAQGSVSSKDVGPFYASTPTLQDNEQELQVDSVDTNDVAEMNRQLRRIFLEFARFGTRSQTKTMDIFRFMKLCRECSLLTDPRHVSSIDLIFYKVRFGPISTSHSQANGYNSLQCRILLLRCGTSLSVRHDFGHTIVGQCYSTASML